MGEGPKDLSSVRWLFWLFAVALSGLASAVAKRARAASAR
jgi:hypothetical protein